MCLTPPPWEGRQALLRDDIGRLAVNAKADIVIVDIEHPLMRPGREPLRNLINVAAERAVKDVFIDGKQVVADGDVLTLEYESSLIEMDAAQIRSIRKVPELDFQNRTLDQLAPMTFPVKARMEIKSDNALFLLINLNC